MLAEFICPPASVIRPASNILARPFGFALSWIFLLLLNPDNRIDSRAATAGFALLTAKETAVTFANPLPIERHLTNQILANGSGVAAADIDGDGLVDLFFAGLGSSSRLYRNLGNFRFQDVTDSAGLTFANVDASGTAFADLDGDGAMDLIVNSLGAGTRIFWNDGKGYFTLNAETLNPVRGGSSLAVADIDGDGLLDIYIANYRTETIKDQPNTRFSVKMVDGKPTISAVNGRPTSDPSVRDRFNYSFSMGAGVGKFSHVENGEPDMLYHNEGNRRFKEIPFTGGGFLDEAGAPLTRPPLDWGLSVMFRDINGDGAPDIYVCNDFNSPDRMWINDGAGHFRSVSPAAIRHLSYSSMAVDFADLNRDGFDDFFTADMLSPDHHRRLTQKNIARTQSGPGAESIESRPQNQQNCLFVNRGDGTFAEAACFSGLEASDWSWASIFLDVDLDGYEDLLIANGFVRDNMNIDIVNEIDRLKAGKKLGAAEQLELRRMFPLLNTRNIAFRNLGNLQFEDASKEWRFNEPVISQGMCLADLDNDGDMDVIVNNLNAPASIYRNEASAARVGVRLKGAAPNSKGIGAKISVLGGAVTRQTQEIIAGGRYLSSDEPMRSFAAGSATNKLRIEVTWRNGRKSVLENAAANHIYEIDEATAKPAAAETKPQAIALFEDVSKAIDHTSHLQSFADFDQQPSLPHKMEGCGPGVAWLDLDGDGWDDLIIGATRGNATAIYLNNKNGGFIKSTKFAEATSRDQLSVLAWNSPNEGPTILASFSNYHDAQPGPPGIRAYKWNRDAVGDILPAESWSFGAIAMADFDGDGDLDLFVAGRVIPGRYPEAAPSRIYVNDGKSFRLAQELTNIGLVNGAVWSDIIDDARPELILACEWGPIRVFKHENGAFKEITVELGLDQHVGNWNGVTTGDFDGDGKMDIVAGNWGENTEYHRYEKQRLQIHYGQIEQREVVLFSAHEPDLGKRVAITPFEQATKSMPALIDRFPTAAKYADASIEEILGPDPKNFHMIEATRFASTVFLNRGGKFAAADLPLEAQLTPAFAVCVGDVDGDGAEDIFLSQNFFGVDFDKTRLDSGRGLWIRGDNKAHFECMPGQTSGILAYGEQRGAALCDYDRDGRIDLVLTQRGAETKLYHNVGAEPGLRVTLKGEGDNPLAIGALVRMRYADGAGAAREIHLGAGYLSQDSATLVFGRARDAKGIFARWPSGRGVEYALPANAHEVELRPNGELRVLK